MANPIDLDHLDQYICGDEKLLDEVLTIFERQALGWIEKLKPDLPNKEWLDAAHALKGASRGVGAWSIGDLAEDAERLTSGDAVEQNRQVLLETLKRQTIVAIDYARAVRDGKSC